MNERQNMKSPMDIGRPTAGHNFGRLEVAELK